MRWDNRQIVRVVLTCRKRNARTVVSFWACATGNCRIAKARYPRSSFTQSLRKSFPYVLSPTKQKWSDSPIVFANRSGTMSITRNIDCVLHTHPKITGPVANPTMNIEVPDMTCSQNQHYAFHHWFTNEHTIVSTLTPNSLAVATTAALKTELANVVVRT